MFANFSRSSLDAANEITIKAGWAKTVKRQRYYKCLKFDFMIGLSRCLFGNCAADIHENKFSWSHMSSKIKLAVCFLFQRLRISRHHPGGSLRLSAPQTAPEPHGLHGTAAGSAGEDFPEDPLPGRSDERAAGHVHQPARSPSAGKPAR